MMGRPDLIAQKPNLAIGWPNMVLGRLDLAAPLSPMIFFKF